ncbi:MAG: NAD-dependent epimerase/dehydratase family protein [Anaerolineales bacterium]|nr:NAD-dependent epimerase/dehydratase family protein [Anaerolineales bacterium]
MTEKQALITGASGEIGQALVQELSRRGGYKIVTADFMPLPKTIEPLSAEHVRGDLLYQIKKFYDYDFDVIFHLAASLSSKAEVAMEEAQRINVEGTLQLLLLAAHRSEKYKKSIKFLFPSSIAAYGLPSLETKQAAGLAQEDEWSDPRTMYGCNKLYCEKLGLYYSQCYGQKHLDETPPHFLDFRAVRFPGLISAFTAPSGGTSDYGPEMLHAAAQGQAYACFVRPDTKISFMAMPDAIRSLLMLLDAPPAKLTRRVYNVTAFAITAEEFRQRALRAFPQAQITFAPDRRRQGIVDSWPTDVDDTLARKDWGWQPAYDVERFFDDYFLPEMKKRYLP